MSILKPNRRCLTPAAPILLMLVWSCVTGCSCIGELQKAQTMYNDATQSLQIGVDLTPAQREEYQQTINQVEQNALPCLKRDDLKVNAYAIDAFARWRLGDYTGAIAAADKGRSLYESAKLTTNQRDYAMLLLTSGLALQSEAHQEYRNRLNQGYLSPAEARQIGEKMDNALAAIDSANTSLDKNNPLSTYAGQQELLILWDQINVWSKGVKDQQDWEQEVRRAVQRGEEIAQKIPPDDPFTQNMLKQFSDTEQSLASSP